MPEAAGDEPGEVMPPGGGDEDPVHYDAVMGLEFGDVAADRVTGSMEIGDRHHQPFGLVHGGVYAGIIESLCSTGAHMWAWPQGKVVVGVSNSTDFLRAHRTGRIDAVAEPIHRGGRQQLWQCVITRASDGKVVARGQVRLQNLPKDFFED